MRLSIALLCLIVLIGTIASVWTSSGHDARAIMCIIACFYIGFLYWAVFEYKPKKEDKPIDGQWDNIGMCPDCGGTGELWCPDENHYEPCDCRIPPDGGVCPECDGEQGKHYPSCIYRRD